MDGREKSKEDRLRPALRRAGRRRTSQREAVWRLFAGETRGLTIAEAAGRLGSRGIGPATVYRAVALFEKLQLLDRIDDPSGGDRFVPSAPGHSHLLLCRACGRTERFRACEIGVLERLLAVETGYQILEHTLEFRGLCPACVGEEK